LEQLYIEIEFCATTIYPTCSATPDGKLSVAA